MWPNNFGIWQFGGGGSGFTPPWQSGGGQPSGGNVPWWVGVGVGLGERLGVWDWAADQLGLPGSGGGGSNGGYPTSVGGPNTGTGLSADFVNNLIDEDYKNNPEAKRGILAYYQGLEGAVQRFVDWLKTLGLAGSIVQRMISGDIFQWPGILQDLIILYYHNLPKAQEIGPVVVEDANRNAGPALSPGPGGFNLSGIAALRPPTLPLVPREAYHVPKGYVLIRHPQTGQRMVVLKELARAIGAWKPRAKAPIKASEWRAAKKAKAIENKLSKMLGDSCNYKVTKKR